METLPRRSQTTRTTETTSIAWKELSSIRTIGMIIFEAIIWKRSQTTRRSGWSKAIPEVITLFPVIENKFGPDGAEAEKIIHKCSQRVWGLFEISRESPWHQVSEEILCLRGTLLASQCRKIKRESGYQSTRFALRIKSSIYVASVCKTRATILLSDPETWLTTPRLLPLRRSRRPYENY